MKNLSIVTLILSLMSADMVSAEVITYECSFPRYEGPNGGGTEDFGFTIQLDTVTEDAYIVGSQGLAKLAHIPAAFGRSFIEFSDTGNVMVTTIAEDGKAVHSRNTMMFGDLIPSQYYGECKK